MPLFGPPNVDKLFAKRDVDKLIKALSHKYEDVRSGAVFALGNIGDPRAVEPLTLTLRDKEETPFIRKKAAHALAKIGDARALETLKTAFKDGNENESIRKEIAWSLNSFLKDEIIRDLQQLGSTDANLKMALSPLLSMLTSGSTVNYSLAASTLAQLADGFEIIGGTSVTTISKLRMIEAKLKML